MILLATVTQGYALKGAEALTKKERKALIKKIEDNNFTDEEFLEAGFKPVHFEGLAWEEN